MNGAMAEPFASTSKTPTSTSVITMGAIQYFLFARMNWKSSLITYSFDINPFHTKAQSFTPRHKENLASTFVPLCLPLCLCVKLPFKTSSRSDDDRAQDIYSRTSRASPNVVAADPIRSRV